MPTPKIKEVLKRIDSGIENFVKDLPDSEKKIYDKVLSIVKQLELDTLGNVTNNVNNLKLVTTLNKEINNLVLNNDYLKKVSEFTGIYDDISKLNNEYLSTTFDKFKPSKVLPKIKEASIDITIDQLTEHGVAEQLSNEIKDLLTNNIKSGGSYSEMIDKLSTSIKGNDKVDGGLTRYSKQLATDSIHQYNATYTKQISSDLGSEFFVYSGSNIDTTRPFCDHLTAKDDGYFHISEVKGFLNGIVGDKKVELDKKTKLPSGFYSNTTEESFFILRGGYNCGHQIFPVQESSVPSSLLNRIKSQQITTKETVVDVNGKKIISENDSGIVLQDNGKNITFANATNKLSKEFIDFDKLHKYSKPEEITKKEYDNQVDAIRDYQGGYYKDINAVLRGEIDINDDKGNISKSFFIKIINGQIKDLDNIINSNELKSDTILWRGYTSNKEVTLKEIEKLLVGTNLKDPAFKSTSISRDVALSFLDIQHSDETKSYYLLKILARKGTKGIYVDNLNGAREMDEKEFLLKREYSFKVLNDVKEKESTINKGTKKIKYYELTVEIV